MKIFLGVLNSQAISANTVGQISLDFSGISNVTSALSDGYTVWIANIYAIAAGVFVEQSGYNLSSSAATTILKYNNTTSATSIDVRAIFIAIK